jgi:hypothetical protein
MKMKKTILLAMTIVASGFQLSLLAQSYADSLAKDEHDIITSIAPYSLETRTAILDVAQYPQALVKLERIQGRSSQSFQDMISSYPREDQEKFYEASRFPAVLNMLVKDGQKSNDDAKAIMKDVPAQTQTQILDIYTAHYKDVETMSKLYQSSQQALEKVIAPLPLDAQKDFHTIIGMPDVMSLLTDNIDLTVSMGEAYKANPVAVTNQLDSISGQINKQNEKDLADYKKEVESNPAMQDEMRKAADDFSASYAQGDNPPPPVEPAPDPSTVSSSQPVAGDGSQPTVINNNYYGNNGGASYNPYPYWFSYPIWYSTPVWYPRPFYYQTGFYYGPGGKIVVCGLPSRVYANWFFTSGYRNYPNLYHHYNTYYNVHERNITNVNIYKGFNSAAREHFTQVNRTHTVNNRQSVYNRPDAGHSSANFNQEHNTVKPMKSNQPVSRPAQNNSFHPTQFNNASYHHYQATTFHTQSWQGVGGGGGARTSSSSGGMRSGGFGGGGGGGRRR